MGQFLVPFRFFLTVVATADRNSWALCTKFYDYNLGFALGFGFGFHGTVSCKLSICVRVI